MRGGRSPAFVIGFGAVFTLVIVAVFAPLLAPYDPHDLSGDPLTAPSLNHWLGTNDIGQDVLSQVIWGTRWSISLAVSIATLSIIIGTALGVGAPLLGRAADAVLMRAADVLLAIPALPLLILVVTLAGPNRTVLVVSVALFIWPRIARILRSQVLSLRSRGFVESAEGFGGGRFYIMRRHLVPAIGPLIGASFIEVAGMAIFLDAGLAFLGLGDPTAPSWGLMLNRANNYPGLYFSEAWTWWVLPPAVAIGGAVLALTFTWIGLEPLMNRRLATSRMSRSVEEQGRSLSKT